MSFSQSDEASHAIILHYDTHKEQVAIRARPFFLPQNTKEYRECHSTSTPCCCSGIDINKVKQAIKKYCDEHFGVACWVEGHYERQLPRIPDSTCGSPLERPSDQHGTNAERPESQLRGAGDDTHGDAAHDAAHNADGDTAHDSTTDDEAESGQPSNKRRRVDQPSNKRRRVDHGPPNANRPEPGSSKDHNQARERTKTIEDFPGEFVQRVRDGLNVLRKRTHQDVSQSDLGTRLFEHWQKKTGHSDSKALENILKDASKKQKSLQWLIDHYHRYASFRRRRILLNYSETGDLYVEQGVMKKEKFCKVVSKVVNRLGEFWGPYASLIYSALEATKYKGSLFTKNAGKGSVDTAANSIIKLLGEITEVSLPMDTLVMNPALFLSCVEGLPYSQVCMDIGLDKLVRYDFQQQIDKVAPKLKETALNCGKIPLSTIIPIASTPTELDTKTRMVTITLRPARITNGNSQESELPLHSASESPRLRDDTEPGLHTSDRAEEGSERSQSPTDQENIGLEMYVSDGNEEHSGQTTPCLPETAKATGFPKPPSPALPPPSNAMAIDTLLGTSPSSPHLESVQHQQGNVEPRSRGTRETSSSPHPLQGFQAGMPHQWVLSPPFNAMVIGNLVGGSPNSQLPTFSPVSRGSERQHSSEISELGMPNFLQDDPEGTTTSQSSLSHDAGEEIEDAITESQAQQRQHCSSKFQDKANNLVSSRPTSPTANEAWNMLDNMDFSKEPDVWEGWNDPIPPAA